MTYFWGSLKECKYEWTSVNNADGYQYEVRKATGKKVYDKKATIFSYTYFKVNCPTSNRTKVEK